MTKGKGIEVLRAHHRAALMEKMRHRPPRYTLFPLPPLAKARIAC